MLKTAFIPNTPIKIVLEDYYLTYNGIAYKIPAWYAFDWLSIPRVFQWVVDMNMTDNIAIGCLHDYFYSQLSGKNKRFSDEVLLNMLGEYNAWWRCCIVYLWVHFFGFTAYRKDSNYDKYRFEIHEARKQLWLKNLTVTL